MIDYDKLKLAHELANKYAKSKEWDINLLVCFDSFKDIVGFILTDGYGNHRFHCIDTLIEKLKELTPHLQPKYKDGEPRYEANIDCVWDRLEQKLIKYEDMIIGEVCSYPLPERFIGSDHD